jgi:hypothetical protein
MSSHIGENEPSALTVTVWVAIPPPRIASRALGIAPSIEYTVTRSGESRPWPGRERRPLGEPSPLKSNSEEPRASNVP